jgi:SAM-dependent methyltransferase
VTGIDIDESTVEHSRANYAAPNLEFRVASATDMSVFQDDSFDAVVAFEMIEHVAEHERVLGEIARVLAPSGLLIMSTPERRTYSEDRDFVNPFHERELTQDEFTALLHSRFSTVALFAQNAIAGSRIEALTGPPASGHLELPFERSDGEWRVAGPPPPFYMIALATNADLPTVAERSTLFDYGLEVLAERQTTVESLLEELRQRRKEFLEQSDALRARFVAELDAKQGDLTAEQARAQRAEDELRQIHESTTWQMLERGRRTLYGRIGPESVIGRSLRRLLARFSPGRNRGR